MNGESSGIGMQDAESTMDNAKYLGPLRDKWWSELTADERIERMREMVRPLADRNRYLEGEVSQLRNQLAQHQHSDGRVCVPLTPYGHDQVMCGSNALRFEKQEGPNPDDVYF